MLEITNEVNTYKIKVLACDKRGIQYDSDWSEVLEYLVSQPQGLACRPIDDGAAWEICALDKSAVKGKIIIPENVDGKPVTRLVKTAFAGCENMTSIYIPDSVMDVKDSSFQECINLSRVRLPAYLDCISTNLFYKCTKLKCINLPENISEIGISAFQGCSALKTINFPFGLVNIKNLAFCLCESLESITFPMTLKTLGIQALYGTSGLTSITVDEENSFYKSENNCLILKSDNSLILGCATSVIPEYVTAIGEKAFALNKKIERIFIPSGIVSIDSLAFVGCDNLTRIIVSKVNHMYKAEGNCIIQKSDNKLVMGCVDSIIPDYVEVIGPWAFRMCPMKSINLPDGLKRIKENAFSNCSQLTSIDLPEALVELGDQAFSNCTSLTSINLPVGLKEWGLETFYNCSGLTSVNIPSGIEKIGDGAFSGCIGIKDISIAESVSNYGNKIFKDCMPISLSIPTSAIKMISHKYLQTVVLTSGTSIDDYAFYSGEYLENVTIPDTVMEIGSSAFSNCKRLSKITIPSGVNSIGNSAFAFTALTQITIPNKVTNLGLITFFNCDKLASITIGSGVKSIGMRAFKGCNVLSEIFYFGTIDEWNKITIDEENDELLNATLYCYSETEPTGEGNYWHYDSDGVTTVKW